jgi:hypothetical protein
VWRLEQCLGVTELYRLRGALHLLLSTAHHLQTEADFRHALALARQQQAKAIELRAAVSPSRWWLHQGKRAEARELLAPILGRALARSSIRLCLLVNLHAVPIGFRDVEAIVAIERDRHRPPEIRLGLGRDVVRRVKVRRQGRHEI